MAVKDILRVLFEPHKVFKDIIKDPNYLGPMVLLIIFVLAQIAGSYMVASRSYVEQTMPIGDLGDDWTANALDWTSTSGVNISNNTIDFINSSLYYGPTSVEFDGLNLDLITMELASFGDSVNCGPEGFNNVSLRIKIISPDYSPDTASLTLYSLDDSSFVYDLADEFENDLGVWKNLTLPAGFGDWTSSGNEAVWENITGIKLEFSWSINSTINILVDGLFFRGDFRGPIELFGISYFASTAINAVAPFLFQWLLLTGFMYLLIKASKRQVLWRTLMVAVGYSLIVLVIQGIFLIVVYSYLPDVFYTLEVLAGTPGEFEVAYQVILDKISFVSNIGTSIQLAIYIWIIGLGVFITKAITELGWMKSLLISGASLLLTIIVLGFLL
ncbi:MAG: hypothetical protein NWF10_07885 [Candidatus Bathyarchaeota archaeon]|nr:hypothetical protein [Candidatus Bathyarchaeota archaeon]